MSVQESTATALIRFTGLGIICFNGEKQRGEIGVIRDNNHTLSIKIQQPVFQDGAEKDIIAYQDVASYKDLPKENVQIEVKASGNPTIAGYEIYQSGDFDRLGSADVNDFRWLVNMSNLHGEGTLGRSEKQNYPLAKIYISNGLFYTHKLDRNLFFEKVEKDSQGTATQREAFGNVAETVGVKLDGEEVTIIIRIGEQEETHALRRVAGLPYRIEIKNMDHSPNAVYCETGFERFDESEGAIGVARALLALGAPLVVASQWKVDSEPTRDLMIAFHRNRKGKGLTSAESLRQAQLEMLSQDRTSAPFYWAAFSLFGGYSTY